MAEELVARGTVVDAGGAKTTWSGYRVTFELTELVDLTDDEPPIATAVELSGDVATRGDFSVTLPARDKIVHPVTLKVMAPAGEVLLARVVTESELLESLQVPVVPKAIFEIPRNRDPFVGETPKLQGRVLDVEGKKQIANRQVIVFAVRDELAEPVVVARTDAQGYFSVDYPRATDDRGRPAGPLAMARAHAIVAGATDVSGGSEIAIGLVTLFGTENVLPRSIVLVVTLADDPLATADPNGDCDCSQPTPRAPDANDLATSSAYSTDLGGGKCVNLTVPNRSVEEYSFFTVVRTTDPEIVGTQDGDFDTAAPERIRSLLSGLSDVLPTAAALPARAVIVPPPPARVPSAASRTPIRTSLVMTALSRRGASLEAALDEAVRASEVSRVSTLIKRATPRPAGRSQLSARNRIRWDDDVKFYEAASIAHGHLLHFKQVWRADGYSLGDLLYSLPLAPGQKKQIAVVDWERRDVARRDESLTESESLTNLLQRDRDISEIVTTALSEQMHGESTSLTVGAGQGQGAAGSGSSGGFNMGAVSGSAMSGGYSEASADQNAARDLSANASQKIRDKTFQAAAAVRNQRVTVVQSVAQGERVSVTTEVIANHNHCHAMTMEYFEVLRHFVVTVELANVSECLYVPLEMAPFTRAKALRWRDQLVRYLRKPALARGFDAMQRIEDGDDGALPATRFADEEIRFVEGSLTVEVRVPTGGTQGVLDEAFDKLNTWLWGSSATNPSANPGLQINAVGSSSTPLPIAFTLLGDFTPNAPMAVRMYPSGPMPGGLTRAGISAMQMQWDATKSKFPDGSLLILRSAQMRYRTDHLSFSLFDEQALNSSLAQQTVSIDTPLSQAELRNPHQEDEALEKKLLAHLNEHLEYYHKAIWWGMDSDRRFMLLDGFLAPNANGRSVASVVENKLIGFIGNSMILPVGHGIQLDPTYTKGADTPATLLDLYATERTPAVRISVPTRGVFAEAVMGSCNACEEKDETRFWRWEESPIDEPTSITSPTADSRYQAPPSTTPTALPTPLVSIQNALAEPDPTGLAAALKVIGTPNLFPNITGLDQTQKNSLEALKANLEAAKYFGGEAAKLAQQASMQKGGIDKSLQSISAAEKAGMIDAGQKNALAMKALGGLVGDGASTDAKKKNAIEELTPSLKKQVDKGGVKSLEAEGDTGEKLKAQFTTASLITTDDDDGSVAPVATAASSVTSAPMLVPVATRDRIFADGVAGVVVTLTKTGGTTPEVTSAATSVGGTAMLNLSNIDDGVYDVVATPDVATRWDQPVGPDLVGSARRMWRSERAIVAVKGRAIVGVLDPIGIPSDRFSLSGGGLRVVLEPVWVAQNRRFGGKPYDANNVEMVVVHHTAGFGDGADTVGSFRGTDTGSHYVVHASGEITKMVNESERAAHVDRTAWQGNTNLGSRSVGIEIANRAQPYTEAQYTALIGLLHRIVAKFGLPPTAIVGHSDVALQKGQEYLGERDVNISSGGTADPGQHFDWSRLAQEGLGIDPVLNNPEPDMYGGFFATNPTGKLPSSGPQVAELRADLEAIGYRASAPGSKPDVRDTALTNAIRAFELHFFSGPLVPSRRVLVKEGSLETAAQVDAEVAEMIKRVKAAPH